MDDNQVINKVRVDSCNGKNGVTFSDSLPTAHSNDHMYHLRVSCLKKIEDNYAY